MAENHEQPTRNPHDQQMFSNLIASQPKKERGGAVSTITSAVLHGGLIVLEGTPEQLKAELRQRRGLDAQPTLDQVFLDATGRTRERIAGEVQEVSA